MEPGLEAALLELVKHNGRLVVLTGAGISAESGIPTFRGPEGYWTVGSVNYRPEEMATFSMFRREPEAVWQWYLYRIGLCRAAEPNAGHLAVVELERLLGDRFLLITQNVDGLHLRAGNTTARTYQIHGNIETVRCGADCSPDFFPISPEVAVKGKDEPITDTDLNALKCPKCKSFLRPHVLWFDETYNEEYYRFRSSLEAAQRAQMLITVGTSGATNLPMQMGMTAAQRGACIVDVNPDDNPFSHMAKRSGGFFCQGPSGSIMPEIASFLASASK